MTAATTPECQIKTELDGHTLFHKAWRVREVMAFKALLKREQTMTDFVDDTRTMVLDGLDSFDGKTGEDAIVLIDDLLPRDLMRILHSRSNQCYASAEDKKKSESYRPCKWVTCAASASINVKLSK